MHSIERFAERVFSFKYEDSIKLNRKQKDTINDLLLSEMAEEHPEAFNIGTGVYVLRDYKIKVSITDFTITTISSVEQEACSKIAGGIIRSGRKIKKKRATKYVQERQLSKENYRAFNGKDD